MITNELKYAFAWLQQRLRSNHVEIVDFQRAGKYAEDLYQVYEAHEQGGPTRAKAAFEQRLKQSPQTAGDLAPRYAALTVKDLEQLPPPQWLIPEILPKQSLAVLYGAPGKRKSFLALHYAMKLAKTQRVVYIAAEGQSGYKARVQANQSIYGDAPGLYLVFEVLNLFDREAVERFIMEYELDPPALVVIDTLASSMFGGDENSSKDMGLVVANCRDLIRSLNTTVLLIHHTGKNGDSERGSSSLRGAADVMMELKLSGERITLKCIKMKEAPHFKDRAYTWSESAGSCVILEQSCLPGKALEILTLLSRPEYAEAGARNSEIGCATNLKGGQLMRHLSELIEKGHVEQAGERQPYKITPSGRAVLHPLEEAAA